jgi:hypothetical protein
MSKKKRQGLADKEQSDCFKETARHIGADETGKTFERVFKKIVPPKKPIRRRK